MNLGSWKCGANLRIWYRNTTVGVSGNWGIAGSRGLASNARAIDETVEYAETWPYHAPGQGLTVNAFTNDDCTGGSTFLWLESGNDMQLAIGTLFGDIHSIELPAGVLGTFYTDGPFAGDYETV